MSRIFLVILVVVNAAFYAWMRYGISTASPEAQLISQQINPDAIRLLPAEAPEGAAPRSSGMQEIAACLEWGAFNAADIARARKALEQFDDRMKVSETRPEESSGWWVFIPPQASRQAANQKLAELRSLGLTALDYFIVQDDSKLRFAISLGVFRTEDAARRRVAQLRERGVRSAQIESRATPVRRVFLQLRGLPPGAREKLTGLREDFPGTDLRECRQPDRTGSG